MGPENIPDEFPPVLPGDLETARLRWDGLAKPLGSLGQLEDAITKMAALSGNADFSLRQRTLLVICADNGVIAQGVSQSDETVTAAVTKALGAGESTVSYMARQVGCGVLPVDVGVKDFTGAPGVMDRRIRNGTDDITAGPAMERRECLRALELGIELAGERKEAGDDCLLLGEMGIGNTTTSCAVAAVLLRQQPEELAGRGSGLSDQGMERKIRAVETAIERNRPDPADPVDILQKVGGLDLVVLTGLCLGGRLYRLPVILDGMISDTAALCAVRMRPAVREALTAGHQSQEPAAEQLLSELQLNPLISAGMRLGEGSGAVAALGLLDTAMSVYQSGHTFQHLGIDAYTPQV
ncbi:MAG: nicotinate-nucleotide--dimethylbenzimidazole phosphoribosyltransferase [Oscillospiraceae bacterium]|nr:nicotinate-nucleotide--dimethylbenzimidazole phosphoribosyltransferase [Oscillospiraceae bacterium]